MDQKIVDNIKTLAIDMINEANSGHPGIALGAAPILYTLYANHMNISTSDPLWMNRDRFVMSAGHGSALLYATLYMAGFNITLDDLKRFRRYPSRTPGHPEVSTPGVDVATGPLGQGFAMGVGLALGEKMLRARTCFHKKTLVNHNVYVLCGDGDLMEGISYEAASLAGSLNLDNLIVLYDSNSVSLDGPTTNTFNDNIKSRFKSMGWDYLFVKDGTSIMNIDKAINKAKQSRKPTIIEIKTKIGNGSFYEGLSQVHGKPLDKDDIRNLKEKLGIPNAPFYVDDTLRNTLRKRIAERSNAAYVEWANTYREFATEEAIMNQIAFAFNGEIKCDFLNHKFDIDYDMKKEATRVTNKRIMNEIASYIPFLVGLSADVASTTNAYLENGGDVLPTNYLARNIRCGVREHAMGAIANGLALCNFRPFASSFLSFADYLKPAIRMSALMQLPVIYIFTHDSILVGQDGPTHQPIEQLAMLRSIPNVDVYRPCDAKELVGAWNTILNQNKKPSVLILSRSDVPLITDTAPSLVEYGAYVVKKSEKKDLIMLASGTEVQTAFILAEKLLNEYKLDTEIVSMVSWNLFNEQPKEYQDKIIEPGKHVFVIEAATSFGLDRFATDKDHILGIDTFGVSGTSDEVLTAKEFDIDSLMNKLVNVLKGQK